MKKVAMLMIALFVLAGCNTINGMGKDIKAAGSIDRRRVERRSEPQDDASLPYPPGPGRADGPRQRRHRRDHPEAVPEVDPAQRLRAEPVRRLALPRPRRAGSGPGIAPAQSRLRAQPAALPRCIDPAGTAQFRLWFVARTRAVGARSVRFSGADCAELCRHLLQQLLQERTAAHRAAREHGRASVRRDGCLRRLLADGGSRTSGRHQARRHRTRLRRRTVSQGMSARRLRRHRPHAAPCRQDPRVRGGAPVAHALVGARL